MNLSYIALIIAAACIGVLGAGCGSGQSGSDGGVADSGIDGIADPCNCAACSHPFGACPGEIVGDGGVPDAMSEQ